MPSTIKLNPKEHCNAVTMKSKKELEAPLRSEKFEKEDKEINSKEQVEDPERLNLSSESSFSPTPSEKQYRHTILKVLGCF